MIKHAPLLVFTALSILLRANLAHADLVPFGGEGVHDCRDKKAGDPCTNAIIEDMKQRFENGTCVEEDLSHLRFRFKAHLRCHSASIPRPPASAAKAAPSADAVPTPSATVPPPAAVASTAPSAATTPTPPPTTESSNRGGCSVSTDPSNTVALGFFMLGVGVLWRARRRSR